MAVTRIPNPFLLRGKPKSRLLLFLNNDLSFYRNGLRRPNRNWKTSPACKAMEPVKL